MHRSKSKIHESQESEHAFGLAVEGAGGIAAGGGAVGAEHEEPAEREQPPEFVDAGGAGVTVGGDPSR
ncbi:hypothetical protein AB0K16_26710 [Nonomuraea jabiensis]|uniref:hypothetical protein n=1 Tax=Nonomuraea jabiensis TaxID=882448 RepID=UPI003445126C